MKCEVKGNKNLCKLSDLRRGDFGIVVRVNGYNNNLRKRILEMGLTMGTRVEIKKIAPLGDPVGIIVRGYELCLRREELKKIEVMVTR